MQVASSPDSRVIAGRVSTQIVVLLAVAVFIDYIDRGNLATAAPLLKKRFGSVDDSSGNLAFSILLDVHADAVDRRLDGRTI